jgi:quercetin dioxygenase-like cupin family protein
MKKATCLSRTRTVAALATVIAAGGCADGQRSVSPQSEVSEGGTPRYTAASGASSVLLGRSFISEGFKVKRRTGTWEMDIQAKDPIDVVVATLTIEPGGHMGWHSHPGPGFVQVTAGTVRFYEADDPSCTPIEKTVGQAWLDRGETTHIARNETNAPVTLLVTVFVPPGAIARIDEPPGNCPF